MRLDTSTHVLRLCEDGNTAIEYVVSLGRGGLGKEQEGDRKTPLGRYRLGKPRRSKSFHTFILVVYPTPEQRRRGFTGGDVGIHGPVRARASEPLLAAMFTRSDWTDGCIAVDSDLEIQAIARWVERTGARWIEIE